MLFLKLPGPDRIKVSLSFYLATWGVSAAFQGDMMGVTSPYYNKKPHCCQTAEGPHSNKE
jgi:hypothetical protein